MGVEGSEIKSAATVDPLVTGEDGVVVAGWNCEEDNGGGGGGGSE